MTGPAGCHAMCQGTWPGGRPFHVKNCPNGPAPAVPSGDTADEPCLGYDSDGVPDGRCANCGVTRGEHPPSGDTAAYEGTDLFWALRSGDTPRSCADDAAPVCGNCPDCVPVEQWEKRTAGTAAATECSDPHCSSFPGVCRDARHHADTADTCTCDEFDCEAGHDVDQSFAKPEESAS